MNFYLHSDKKPNLPCGQSLVSHTGRARFTAQEDGNLCMYAVVGPNGQVRYIWGSGTNGQALGNVCMGSNGEVAAFKPNSADTVWKSGSWNSGKPGPFQLVLVDYGDLVVNAGDGEIIWNLGTKVSPEPIKFSSVRFKHAGGPSVACPLVKDWSGENDLWNEQGFYWALAGASEKVVNFDEDTVEGEKYKSMLIGDKIGGSGTICALGFNIVYGTDVLIDPLRERQFIYERGCKMEVTITKQSGWAEYNSVTAIPDKKEGGWTLV